MRRTIEVALRANVGQFQAQMGAASAQVRTFGGNVTSTMTSADKATQKSLQTVSRGALLLGGAMLVGFGVAVKAAAGFEKEMAGVKAVSGATASEMDLLGKAALKAGADTVFSASEAAQAQAELVKAGISTADVLGGALTGSLALAAAGQLDLKDAAEISAQAMNIFKLSGRDVGHIADVLAAGANKSAADVGQLGEALRQGGLLAAQTGLTLEETVGALSAFADNALIGSDAGTSLKTMLQRLNPQSKEAAQLMEQLGFSAYDAEGQFIGLEGLAGELQSALAGMSAEQRNAAMQTLFGSDAVRAANILFTEGAEGIAEYVSAVNDQGAATRMAAELTDNLAGDLEALGGSIETALIKGGSGANDVLRGMVRAGTDAVNVIGELPAPVVGAGTAFAGLSGSVLLVLGGIGTLVPKLAEGQRQLANLGTAGATASRLLGGLGKLGAYGAGVGILTGAVMFLGTQIDKLMRGTPDVDRMTQSLLDLAEGKGGIEAVGAAARGNQDDLREFIDQIATGDRRLMQAGRSGLGRALEDIDAGLTKLVEGGVPDRAAEALRRFADAHDVRVEDLLPYLERYGGALQEAETAARVGAAAADEAAGATGRLGAAQAGANVALGEGAMVTEAQKAEAEALAEAHEKLAESLGGFTAPMDAYTTALEANKGEAEKWAEHQNEHLEKTKVSWKDYPGLVKEGLKGEALEANKEKAKEWAQAQNEAIGSAKVSWEDFPGGVAVSLSQYANELQNQIDAQDNWANNLGKIALRGRGDVARELAAMGPEGAALAAEFANTVGPEFDRAADLLVESVRRGGVDSGRALDEELRVLEEISDRGGRATVQAIAQATSVLPEEVRRIARDMGIVLTEEQPGLQRGWARLAEDARREMKGVQRDVPPTVRSTVVDAVREVENNAPAWGGGWHRRYWGARNPTEAMRRDVPPIVGSAADSMTGVLHQRLPGFKGAVGGYTGALEHGIRTVNVSAGASWANVPEAVRREFKGRADGAVVDYYASGGFKEKHVAEIARAGDWRVWAEPETGGEAYIPLAQSKRDRSVPIWLETGRRLGMDEDALYALREAQRFHAGGLWQVPGPPALDRWGHPIRPRGEASLHSAQALAEAVAQAHMKLPHHQAPPPGAGGLAGSTTGLNPEFLRRFMAYSDRVGPLRIVSGWRSSARQAQLYAAYLAGRGNLAARPGTSKHEVGLAIDHAPVANASMKAIARQFRLHYPVRGEPWHVEPFARGGFHGLRSYDRGGYLLPGTTVAQNFTGRPEYVPPPASTPAPSQAPVVINASYDLHVEGEITPRTENRLRAMFDEHDRELIRMVDQGVR
jgi:TP901 family phage tail tape measure protein